MKLAFVSALAFAATQGVNAQMSAPGWAQEQNATVQHAGPGMAPTQRFFDSQEVLLFEITSLNETTEDYTYNVKVVGVNKEKVSGLTALTIAFSDYDEANGPITSKIDAVEAVDVYEPSAMKTKVTGVSLAAITKLTVGINAPNDNTSDHLSTFSTGIVSISDNAFANLTGLTEIITYCEAAPTMKSNAFASSRYSKAKLTVPNIKGKKEYQGKAGGVFANAEGWNNFMYNNKLYVNGSAKFFGDFDNSGSLNSTDVKRMISYLNAIEDDEEYSGSVNSLSLDINGDGSFTSTDVKRLLTIINTIEDM